MPAREIRLGGNPVMSEPLSRMRPEVGRSTPVTQLKKVLLPAPFGPMMARISPRRMSRLTLLTAVKPPKRMVRASVRSTGPVSPPRPVAGEAVARGASACTLSELAGRREDRLVFVDHLEDLVLAAPHLGDDLSQERLVIFLA